MGIIVDFDKAKEVVKTRLRLERQSILEELDIQYQRALESQSDTTAIVAEKQRLRDITKIVDQVTNLDELKAISCTN